MFVTMVEGGVDDAREVICAQIRTSGPRVTSPPVSSSPIWCTLMTECGGSLRCGNRGGRDGDEGKVEKPTAISIFEQAGSRPSVSMWTDEGRAGLGEHYASGARAARRAVEARIL